MKPARALGHRSQIFIAVVIIFLFLVPPLIHFSMQPLRQCFDEASARHAQNLQEVVSLATKGKDPAPLKKALLDISQKEAEKSRNSWVKAERFSCVAFLVGGLFTAVFTTSLIVRRLVGPLISLCSQIKEISSHPSHDVRIDVHGAREFQQISKAFNRHIELLQEKDRQLVQAQQMELAGLLASGMVHEFNTVLTIVRGFAEHLQKQAPDEEARKMTGHIITAVTRGYHLTRALRPFQREGLIQPEHVDINTLVQEVQEEQEKVIGHGTSIEARLWPEPLWVMGDRHYLQQVLINILNNARDAMPDGGMIRIATTLRGLDELALRGYDWAAPGEFAKISVADSGTGMDEATLGRVFQPFFTTKEIGQGTGLGLTMAYGIIREHKGIICVKSEAEQGTEVSIHLPTIC